MIVYNKIQGSTKCLITWNISCHDITEYRLNKKAPLCSGIHFIFGNIMTYMKLYIPQYFSQGFLNITANLEVKKT